MAELPPWRVLSSRIVLHDKWLKLRADTCETAEGVRIEPYYVLEQPDVTLGLAMTAAREIVLVRQYRHAYGATSLELPAGRMDAGENPVEGFLRELGEETGYGGGNARLVRTFSPNTARNANRIHIVVAEHVARTVEPQDDPSEKIETVLWPLADAALLMSTPEFANAIHLGALAVAIAALT